MLITIATSVGEYDSTFSGTLDGHTYRRCRVVKFLPCASSNGINVSDCWQIGFGVILRVILDVVALFLSYRICDYVDVRFLR